MDSERAEPVEAVSRNRHAHGGDGRPARRPIANGCQEDESTGWVNNNECCWMKKKKKEKKSLDHHRRQKSPSRWATFGDRSKGNPLSLLPRR